VSYFGGVVQSFRLGTAAMVLPHCEVTLFFSQFGAFTKTRASSAG
jgi:hypothetical protein